MRLKRFNFNMESENEKQHKAWQARCGKSVIGALRCCLVWYGPSLLARIGADRSRNDTEGWHGMVSPDWFG